MPNRWMWCWATRCFGSLLLMGGLFSGMLLASATAHAQTLVVAASDLRFAMEDLTGLFEKQTGKRINVVYGSSGNFYRQIEQGAPFELFFSADESYVFKLAKADKTLDDGIRYAVGRLVWVVPVQSKTEPDVGLNGLVQAARDNKLNKFAIANPDHAPYGQRAKEVLEYLGIWANVSPHLVLGENVSQALQFALSGSGDGGIVALSLVKTPAVASRVRYVLIPEQWHQPLVQRMVLLKPARSDAKAFYSFMQSAPAREIMNRYGFDLPK